MVIGWKVSAKIFMIEEIEWYNRIPAVRNSKPMMVMVPMTSFFEFYACPNYH